MFIMMLRRFFLKRSAGIFELILSGGLPVFTGNSFLDTINMYPTDQLCRREILHPELLKTL
jgi:hypothetical protein